ncbi:MAG TPA: hypothetical protein VFC07_00540 [Verrucomicrobiae bacterium]|nr:hypothetical protein [Verrucomicrobiae bacterium]
MNPPLPSTHAGGSRRFPKRREERHHHRISVFSQKSDHGRDVSPLPFGYLQAPAQRPWLIREALLALGQVEKDLSRRRKGDKTKVKLVRQLRVETTMPLRGIAGRLRRGNWNYVSNLPREKPSK